MRCGHTSLASGVCRRATMAFDARSARRGHTLAGDKGGALAPTPRYTLRDARRGRDKGARRQRVVSASSARRQRHRGQRMAAVLCVNNDGLSRGQRSAVHSDGRPSTTSRGCVALLRRVDGVVHAVTRIRRRVDTCSRSRSHNRSNNQICCCF